MLLILWEELIFRRTNTPPHCHVCQIWDFASSGAASLTKVQFGTAMRLVALAQVSAGA
jgi:hypothetical protein